MTKRLSPYFKDYSSFHQTRGNKLSHYFGIPLIVITLLGLLSALTIASLPGFDSELIRIDGGVILLTVAGLWYLYLDWKIALPMIAALIGCYFLGRALPSTVLWAGFILGWILQFFGHYHYEKKSPAFYKNFEHLLVGPLWVFSSLVGYQ
jgi:uncharacterized membrane protein YGL010W